MSFKGIIKKTSGVLKGCALFAPLIMVAGGFITGTTGLIGYMYNYDKMGDSIKATPEYVQSLSMATDELREQYANGEISVEDFHNQMDKVISNHYDKYVETDFPGKENYAASLKRQEQFKIAGLTGAGLMGFGTIVGIIWIFAGVGDAIVDSMDDDFSWRPPQKPKKKTAVTLNSGNQQLKPLKESVEDDETEKVDISEL